MDNVLWLLSPCCIKRAAEVCEISETWTAGCHEVGCKVLNASVETRFGIRTTKAELSAWQVPTSNLYWNQWAGSGLSGRKQRSFVPTPFLSNIGPQRAYFFKNR